MGRSATLCGGKPPPLWSSISEHRERLTANLQNYLKADACVHGAPASGKGLDDYRDEVARAYASAIRLEIGAVNSRSVIYGTTVSFAIVYAELWNLATELSADHPKTTPQELRSEIAHLANRRISAIALKEFNEPVPKADESNADELKLLSLAALLSEAYLKAYAECSAAGKRMDAAEIRHHLFILGDVLQEMLELHATLLPPRRDA